MAFLGWNLSRRTALSSLSQLIHYMLRSYTGFNVSRKSSTPHTTGASSQLLVARLTHRLQLLPCPFQTRRRHYRHLPQLFSPSPMMSKLRSNCGFRLLSQTAMSQTKGS
jgi:hypothetical protein